MTQQKSYMYREDTSQSKAKHIIKCTAWKHINKCTAWKHIILAIARPNSIRVLMVCSAAGDGFVLMSRFCAWFRKIRVIMSSAQSTTLPIVQVLFTWQELLKWRTNDTDRKMTSQYNHKVGVHFLQC